MLSGCCLLTGPALAPGDAPTAGRGVGMAEVVPRLALIPAPSQSQRGVLPQGSLSLSGGVNWCEICSTQVLGIWGKVALMPMAY